MDKLTELRTAIFPLVGEKVNEEVFSLGRLSEDQRYELTMHLEGVWESTEAIASSFTETLPKMTNETLMDSLIEFSTQIEHLNYHWNRTVSMLQDADEWFE